MGPEPGYAPGRRGQTGAGLLVGRLPDTFHGSQSE